MDYDDIPEFPGKLPVIYWEHFFSRWAIGVSVPEKCRENYQLWMVNDNLGIQCEFPVFGNPVFPGKFCWFSW